MFRLSSEGLSAFFLLLVPPGVLARPRETQRETQDKSKPFQTTKYSWHLKNLGALPPYLRIFFALCAPIPRPPVLLSQRACSSDGIEPYRRKQSGTGSKKGT